jgi:UDP-glucose 4-epimerase
MKVLVTGVSGFVGEALVSEAICRGLQVRGVARSGAKVINGIEIMVIDLLDGEVEWSAPLSNANVVIHLAARVHIMSDSAVDPLAEFRRVNVAGTLNLARHAATAGVKRFVFMSSIKVNGEQTKVEQPFTEDDTVNPCDAYGISKCEAEAGLRLIAKQTGMEVVIIRPVMVYGPGVKGNFLSMMHWLHKGIPLPLGSIKNTRSFVALDNLVDFIITCLQHPSAANQTFLVSDGEDISTTQLLQFTASAMKVKSRLMPVPALMIEVAAKLLNRGDVAQRLCGNLQVDISKARQLLGWVPPISVKEGLQKAVESYVQSGVYK